MGTCLVDERPGGCVAQMTVTRFDLSRLAGNKVIRTPQGGARIDARLTRTGIFVYRNEDGSLRRELRTPDEVARADSLETLRDAPLIEGHPDLVKPDNYRTLQRGHVSGRPKFDGRRYVESQVVVQDAETLARIDSGDLSELSCGYTCDIDQTAGTFDGQPYDCIQKNIRYNHVGIGPKNWGRAGSDVALRLDSSTYVDDFQEKMKKIRLDGKDFEVAPELFEALDKELDTVRKDCASKVTKAETEAGTAAGQALAEKTRADAAEKTLADTNAKLAEATDPARFDAAVEARAQLIESAHKILGNNEPFTRKDGDKNVPMTSREIMVQVVTALKPEFKADGRSDDYVRALYEHAVESGVRADSITTLPARLDAMKNKDFPSKMKDKDGDDETAERTDASRMPLMHSKER